MAKKLTVQELKVACDAIGKKGKDGKDITLAEIEKWPSVRKGKK